MSENPDRNIIQAEYNANQEAWQDAYSRSVIVASSPSHLERPAMVRQDYENKRPMEAITRGRTQNDLRIIMDECIRVYNSVGLIKNVIDMIADFAADGIEIVHPDERTNIFYSRWAEKIKLRDRARQFVKWYLKAGNVVVRREMFTIDRTKLIKLLELDESDPKNLVTQSGKIPMRYWFYNPVSVEVVGDFLSCYSDQKRYAMRINQTTLQHTVAKNNLEKQILESLPAEIRQVFDKKVSKSSVNAMGSTVYVPIPDDLIYVDSYAKDDSDVWARPIIYGVLQDVYYNEKIKLAKTASLDGMISPIRAFKLGDHTQQLWPAPNSGQLLQSLLKNNTGGGPIDLIWTSDLEIETIYPPVDKLSGYTEDYTAILVGLGIPKVLVAADKEVASNGNVSLKGLIIKIETCRDALNKWLQGEINDIQRAMKFRRRPSIRYRYANLSDERVFFDILLEMADRNIISHQRVVELFRDSYEIERGRLVNEEKELGYEKLSPLRRETKADTGKSGDKGQQDFNGGRPPGSKDSKPRTRRNKEPLSAEMLLTTENKYKEIYDAVLKFALPFFGKGDVRALTAAEKGDIEVMTDKTFANIDLSAKVDEQTILQALDLTPSKYPEFISAYNQILKDSGGSTLKHRRASKVLAYNEIWGIN